MRFPTPSCTSTDRGHPLLTATPPRRLHPGIHQFPAKTGHVHGVGGALTHTRRPGATRGCSFRATSCATWARASSSRWASSIRQLGHQPGRRQPLRLRAAVGGHLLDLHADHLSEHVGAHRHSHGSQPGVQRPPPILEALGEAVRQQHRGGLHRHRHGRDTGRRTGVPPAFRDTPAVGGSAYSRAENGSRRNRPLSPHRAADRGLPRR